MAHIPCHKAPQEQSLDKGGAPDGAFSFGSFNDDSDDVNQQLLGV